MLLLTAAAPIALAIAAPASATEEEAQFWATQQVEIELGDDTALQIEGVERARSAAFGGDQYQFRVGAYRDVGSGFDLGAAVVYQRTGRQDELRLQQQLSYATGPIALRTRLEQRFQEDGDRTGWRLRQRVQLNETLDSDGHWTAFVNAEGIFSLRNSTPGLRTGFVALRSQIGIRHKFSDRLSGTLAYVRQQEFRDGAPDRVGHAPLFGLSLHF